MLHLRVMHCLVLFELNLLRPKSLLQNTVYHVQLIIGSNVGNRASLLGLADMSLGVMKGKTNYALFRMTCGFLRVSVAIGRDVLV